MPLRLQTIPQGQSRPANRTVQHWVKVKDSAAPKVVINFICHPLFGANDDVKAVGVRFVPDYQRMALARSHAARGGTG